MKKLCFALAIAAVIAGLAARYNNSQNLRRLGSQAVALDATGQDAHATLNQAVTFASHHMSAPVRVVLQGAYNRAVEAAQAAAQPSVPNAQVYAQAQAACAGHADSITQAKCNQDYLAKHLAPAAAPVPVAQPKLADYTTDLRSPLWTPDLAGLLLVLALILLVVGWTLPSRGRGHRYA